MSVLAYNLTNKSGPIMDIDTPDNTPTPIPNDTNVESTDNDAMYSAIFKREDEIIQYIKDKATKETLKSLAPLLEKLEEAVKQQQATIPAPSANVLNTAVLNYEDQLKNLQEISKEKIKAKELKVAERLNKLQARIASIRK
ncbi:hypothetical protein D1631_08605 [Chryseobacterium nematophagum]|uniref:Uncharacterized protein n=1 Tax=Chryseobacterium nematophagum TaxID=2305228 RepID=A0A3M7TEP8_9FLAO|nr:hypothetical protein [Chryseobacterium nematophagum]RNA61991.1 hypothetical protein D1631_08605 [Chryseobacterium nematophagum]